MHLYRSGSAARFLAPRLRPLMQARVFAGVEHAHANLLRKVADARSGRLTGADPTYGPANLMDARDAIWFGALVPKLLISSVAWGI